MIFRIVKYVLHDILRSRIALACTILLGDYLGLSMALSAAFLFGVGLPVGLYDFSAAGLILIAVGLLLTFVFVALAFPGAACSRDKARGIGVALLMWFYFSLLYDGLVLYILYAFADYPLEKAAITLISLNPIDLGRVIVLLQMDVSALMGYTGAVMQEFFGSALGTTGVLLPWIVLPPGLVVRVFRRNDL